jgi:2-succinyl-6-hydroxy-2,4-cyclohexadiene-1-carboxylate synthase
MNWKSHGEESNRVLICLHGFMGDASDWDAFAQSFINLIPGWQVVAATLPGHDDGDSVFNENEISDGIFDWMDSRAISSAAIAGYSLGGRLGLRLALDHKARFPLFIGISTTAGISDPEERKCRRISDEILSERMRSIGNRESFTAFLDEWWQLPLFASPGKRDIHRERFLQSRLKKSPVLLAYALQQWSSGVLPSEWDRLGEYPGRVLLLSGQEDQKFTNLSERMQAAFCDAHSHRLIGAGHQLLLECPDEIAAIVAGFLNEKQSKASQ